MLLTAAVGITVCHAGRPRTTANNRITAKMTALESSVEVVEEGLFTVLFKETTHIAIMSSGMVVVGL